MKNKSKIFIAIYVLLFLVFGFGITYSMFYSAADGKTTDQNIAKFIFNSEGLDRLEIPLVNIDPTITNEYPFSVSNTSGSNVSNVTVEYVLTIKTYHFAPLDISLYKINGENEELLVKCDESIHERNAANELICSTELQTLTHSLGGTDNYKLKINFETGHDDISYSDLVDYVNVEINSRQKLTNE